MVLQERDLLCPCCGQKVSDAAEQQKTMVFTEAEYVLEEDDLSEQPAPTAPAAPFPLKQAEPVRSEKPFYSGTGNKPAQKNVSESVPVSEPKPDKKITGLSVAAFLFNLLIVLSPIGVILAIADLVKSRNSPRKKGLSIAALIIGGITLPVFLFVTSLLLPVLRAPKDYTISGTVPISEATSKPSQAVAGKAESPSDKKPSLSSGEQRALELVENLLAKNKGLSYDSLVSFLESNYSNEVSASDIRYAVDHCGADWKEQAVMRAKALNEGESYLSRYQTVSRLQSDWLFSPELAEYGADNSGVDWAKNAVNLGIAISKDGSGFSKYMMLNTLKSYSGFTDEDLATASYYWDLKIDFKEQALLAAKKHMQENPGVKWTWDKKFDPTTDLYGWLVTVGFTNEECNYVKSVLKFS